jgi:hypothetical protein
MSGLASIGLFLLEQTVRKTTAAPSAGSRAGKCTGVLRCDRSFILSEGHALSCPRCLACPGHRVRFITSIRCVPFCFGHDGAWPSDLPRTCDVPIPRLFVLVPVLGLWLDAVAVACQARDGKRSVHEKNSSIVSWIVSASNTRPNPAKLGMTPVPC